MEISKFLNDVKTADKIDFVNTEKNKQTRYLIGLTIYELEAMIKDLNVDEYHSGPLQDKDSNRDGKLWIFKHKYQKHVLYIKLKEKIYINGNSLVKCLSCHIDYM